VQTGRLAGEQLEITSGLPLETPIVASGAGFLNDGDLVRLANGAPSVAAASAPANASAAAR
jgi:hypothetical protein